jgi:tungstate transport system ATP-binding protein
MSSAFRVMGVTKRYKDVTAVKEVFLDGNSGEILGILGPSGAGKSTLLRLIDLLESPDEGSVEIAGKKVTLHGGEACAVRRRIGMVLQKPVVFNRSVWNNLAYGLRLRGWDEDKIRKRVDEELEKLGLGDRKGKNARTLSGGEMQRLCFARSTIFEPDTLLLDEFAANLDPANVSMIENMVKEYAEQDRSRCVAIVTHNLFQARRLCDRVALMWNGEMVEVAERHKFFENPDDDRTASFVKGELVY